MTDLNAAGRTKRIDADYKAWCAHDPAAQQPPSQLTMREAFAAGWLARDRVARIEETTRSAAESDA